MDIIEKIVNKFSDLNFARHIGPSLVAIAVAIIVAVVALKFLKGFFKKFKEKQDNGIPQERKTMMRIIYSLIRFFIMIVLVLFILSIAGVNVSGAVAGLGIAGACGALAVQDLLKDLIQGLNIVSDKYFLIGDVIEVNGFTGKVIELTMRSTKLESVTDGCVITIGNREISTVKKRSHIVDIPVNLGYAENIEYVSKVLRDIAKTIEELPDVEKCEYKGTQEFNDSSIAHLIRLFCRPEIYPDTRRAAMDIIRKELHAADLHIEYNHLFIHTR